MFFITIILSIFLLCVSNASTKFEFFLFRFVYEAVVILNLLVLVAEIYSISNDVLFNGGSSSEN